MVSKSKQEIRQEAVAVADDEMFSQDLWLKPGEWVTIHTADPIIYGRIKAITPSFFFLEEASWIADTGRAHEYAKDPGKTCLEAEFMGEEAVERPVVRVTRHKGNTGKIDTR